MSFEALKRNRGTDISQLVKAAEAAGGGAGEICFLL